MGRAGVAGPARLRAFDKATGELIAQIDLPVGATGGPMTYMIDGRQYIIVPIGGKGYGAGWVALGLGGTTIYTDAQAGKGESIYRAKCSACHDNDLNGQHAPPLIGRAFWEQWNQDSVRALYSRIISTMPLEEAGSLPEKDVLDLVAYLLKANGWPSGKKPIETAGELNNIRLERPR
jgi:S-disulfanyl-L-cysteine oxidoreductase SoxD